MDRGSDSSFSARAKARASWNIHRYELGQEPSDDLSATTSASERLRMMWPLALEAWTFAGHAMPDYPRDKTPIRVILPSRQAAGEPS